MFKRLVFLLMLVTATVSVSPPAQAATLQVDLECILLGEPYVECDAWPLGGVGPYTFRWYRDSTFLKEETTFRASHVIAPCTCGPTTFRVILIDSTGARVSATQDMYR